VVLKNGSQIIVPDADSADWDAQRTHTGGPTLVLRLVCRRGADQDVGRFDAEQIAGYVWTDGKAPQIA